MEKKEKLEQNSKNQTGENSSISNLIYISCPICFKSFNNETEIITLNCGHYFCSNCLGNTNFSGFFKCSMCRTIITNYYFQNKPLVSLYNCEMEKNPNQAVTKDKNHEENIFCSNCQKIIQFSNFHLKEYPSHQMLSKENLIEKMRNGMNMISAIQSNYGAKDYFLKLKTKISNILETSESGNNSQLKNCIESNFLIKEFLKLELNIDTKSESNIQNFIEQNKNKLQKIIKFQKSLRRLKNTNTIEETKSIIIKSHKNLKKMDFVTNRRAGMVSKKYITSYIKNTKKAVIFDIDLMDIEVFEIKDLNFNFFDNSHSVELDSATGKIFISGGKQENFIHSNMSNKIWEYTINKNNKISSNFNSLRQIQSLNYEITDHRSIIIEDSLYIIGGRKGSTSNSLNSQSEDLYYNKLAKLEKTSHILEYPFELKFPRSNFTLAYDNNKLFIGFGITTGGKFLNNIEIVLLDRLNYSSTIVEFHIDSDGLYDSIRLKDAGGVINSENETLIILGGQKENAIKNAKIFYFDLKEYKLIQSLESKEIVSGTFASYGIKCAWITAIISNYTVNDELPHIYMLSDKNQKWTCHSIDIYS